MFALYRLFSYSGDEHRSLVPVFKGDKANNLDKDLKKKTMTSAGFQFSPGVFTVKDADPEETLERFELYLEAMKRLSD